MGVKSSNHIVYNIKQLSIKSIKDIIDKVCLNSSSDVFSFLSKPYRIDVDYNWPAFKIGANKKPEQAASLTYNFLECLAKYGFVVTLICNS